MMAVNADDLPERDHEWGFEVKWDGVRALAFVEDGRARLMSRRGNDVSVTYPELAGLAEPLRGRSVVLDGEIVAVDEKGLPSFGELQRRIHVTDPRQAARLARSVPPPSWLSTCCTWTGDRRWRCGTRSGAGCSPHWI
jgi:bifunctional non-homologous end joining protein LigD